MQQLCARDANKWFQEHYGDGNFGTAFTHFSNHYNLGKNRCYVLADTTTYHDEIRNGERVKYVVDDEMLFDVEDNRQMGYYSAGGPFPGYVRCLIYGGEPCESMKQWEPFEKRYMEE